jgi:hypothetical protein
MLTGRLPVLLSLTLQERVLHLDLKTDPKAIQEAQNEHYQDITEARCFW